MKLKKIAAAAASCVIAASALAVSSSAAFKEVPGNGHFISNSGMWMPLLYSDGTKDVADGKEYTDYGLDLQAIGSIEITFTVDDDSFFDGTIGGGIILSSAGTDHNWVSKNFWGVDDEDEDIHTQDPAGPVLLEKVDDFTYVGVCPVDETNDVPEGAALVQLAVQEWGNSPFFNVIVLKAEVKDKSGNVMISFDENGKASLPLIPQGGAADASAPADAAPAPAAGSVDAATAGGSKDSPDTGIADVAVIAGLAIAAAGVAVVSKKRK